jgi:Glycosyl hydrolase family 26
MSDRALLITALVVAGLVAWAGISVGPAAGPPDTPAPHWIDWGVFLPDDDAPSSNLWTVRDMAGSTPHYVMRFAAMGDPTPIPQLNMITAAGARAILTLEPWQPDAGVAQPDYALARIAAGDLDAQLDTWARNLADWGQPLVLRFAHEMNSDHYPWSVGVNGNSAADYIAAWKHVRQRFAMGGAHNVSFMWCPDSPYEGSTDVGAAFPGTDAVDVLCLDGYNWGDGGGHTWKSPEEIFTRGLDELRALDGQHTIVIAETASVEGPRSGTDKADWIHRLFNFMAREDRVSALLWFQMDKERDWRFNSSTQSQVAFKDAIAARAKP